MKIKEMPLFVRGMVHDELMKEYKHNAEMVNVIMLLADKWTIQDYLPQFEALKDLEDVMHHYNVCKGRIERGIKPEAMFPRTKSLSSEQWIAYEQFLQTYIKEELA